MSGKCKLTIVFGILLLTVSPGQGDGTPKTVTAFLKNTRTNNAITLLTPPVSDNLSGPRP